jgi:hypothetical protein
VSRVSTVAPEPSAYSLSTIQAEFRRLTSEPPPGAESGSAGAPRIRTKVLS